MAEQWGHFLPIFLPLDNNIVEYSTVNMFYFYTRNYVKSRWVKKKGQGPSASPDSQPLLLSSALYFWLPPTPALPQAQALSEKYTHTY